MSKNPLARLHSRLESLFAGLIESTPRTGALSPLRLGLAEKERPQGWVWETDAQGTIVWSSPEIETVLGYSLDEVLDRQIAELGFNTRSSQLLHQAIASQEEIHDLRLEARSRAGEDLVLVANALVRETLAGEKLGYRGVMLVLDRRKPSAPAYAARTAHDPDVVTVHTPAPIAVTWASSTGYTDNGQAVEALTEEVVPQTEVPAGALVVPVRSQDAVLGHLELVSSQAGQPWTEDDRLLVEGVAQQLAMAMQDARSYQLTQQALDEMREADRLKSQFLANMSHELRTPLNSIIGFSRVILKGIDGPVTDTQAQDLQAIYNAGQHLLGLINDILDLSRIEAGKMELAFGDVDIREIIRSVMSTASGLVKDKPIELVVDVPDDLPLIQADNIRVRQILLNLISNACKFTEKGQVGASARLVERSGRREVVVAVFDTGPGIAPADQARLFEPFSQVDASPTRKTGGSGLGLSICRQLVSLHGGRIWVESALGEGSTFAFTLPVEGPEVVPTETTETPIVLAIDDDPATLDLYTQVLTQQGFQPHILEDPSHAIEVVHSLRPSALILDAGLPNLTAWKLFAELRADPHHSRLPILIALVSAAQQRGRWSGPIDLLPIPIGRDDLTSLLRRLGMDKLETPTVLVVSDQEDARQAVAAAFHNATGANTISYEDASEALATAVTSLPDVVVVDADMAPPGGIALLEALKADERTRLVPIVLLLPGPFSSAIQLQLEASLERLAQAAGDPLSAVQEAVGRLSAILPRGRSAEAHPG
jgi:signal transduction histidine kinase/DNA-binding response OmpR family regulator